MKTLLAFALTGGLFAGLAPAAPALAYDACLRPIDINTTKAVDAKTVQITTRGKSRPNFVMTFQNSCPGLRFGNPLVFDNLYSGSQCITAAESVKVLDTASRISTPCMIDKITPASKGAPVPAPSTQG